MVGFSKGAVDYITKPVKSGVKARIDTHLKVQRLQRELQESGVQMLVHVLCHDLANYVGAIYNMAQFLKRSDSVNDAQGFSQEYTIPVTEPLNSSKQYMR